MKRSLLLRLLQEYSPSDEEERRYQDQMTSFVQQNEHCFERSLEIGHITASAWLLNKEGSHALLMHHAKLNLWCQLGGHCDGDPDPLAVALKEASEESGIQGITALSPSIFDIDIHLIPAHKGIKEHFHYDVRFLLQVKSDEKILINHEAKELRWITRDRVSLPTEHRSVVRMFDKWSKH